MEYPLRTPPCITNVNNNTSNEQILSLLQQLVVQNAELSRKVTDLQAKLDLLEHKFDTIAEEAGLI
jgi:cell division protein FtsB